ncbi:DUF488 domain-containing protein [Pedobacter nyackensis]|uniref:Uncharacterized conserved protein YeaO, DUF488 family n=1 Tax=Pedobacter nyackensis TaxID=475255 RepID=A0A1W2F8W1_9SPHI|nr:DUF488 domain-containing protein [Pedobacter nyackensis]SMD18360.1 Uncharacterized conserved protein YeaO, DUF488 family [Pedobacter nyackensis]
MIKIKRIYEPTSKEDGFRILIDRLWPRGMTKENAAIQLWLKEVAPSTSLRKWFDHQPQKWEVFKKKYLEELASNIAVKEIITAQESHPVVTLLYAAHDEQYNHALVLDGFLRRELGLAN